MFAAMPNFADFYTEESVNNQGLECLRFLNEVISDYDALLDQARFANIIKIKTVSSTYMAASGLNCDESIRPDASVRERWFHLAQLTEFALTLKDTLNVINKESFNNFVLRMGETLSHQRNKPVLSQTHRYLNLLTTPIAIALSLLTNIFVQSLQSICH